MLTGFQIKFFVIFVKEIT